MGLNSLSRPGELFTLAWVGAIKSVPESAMSATIHVYHTQGSTYDPNADEWTETVVDIYTGAARVQPLRSANLKKLPGNETTVITFLFSIPVENNTLDIRTGHQVVVTEAVLNPALTTYEFVVSEITDSSNPVERTFLCTMNQETEVA
jgi:hypothetical protein